jgi:uncharacterized repeat protein (TIGR02543 family)
VKTYQVNNLSDGFTYYFSATAYDTARSESSFSNEVSKTFTTSIQRVTLTITKDGTGSGTVTAGSGINCGTTCPTASASYNNGTAVTLTAAPATGSTFNKWTGGCTGTASQCAITLNTNTTVTATFSPISNTITASAGTGGSISPSGSVSVNYDASQTFTITPNTGYSIADVKADNTSVGKVTSYTFSNVTAAHSIQAPFRQTRQNH